MNEPVGQGKFRILFKECIYITSITDLTGEYGIVYKAKLAKGFNTGFSEIVAVKTLKGQFNNQLLVEIRLEIM